MTKSPVFVSSYGRLELSKKETSSLQHALARRMTPLQRAGLELIENWRISHARSFDLVFKEWRAPLYFASVYGELSAYLKEAELINENSLPVSPVAFQHSVQNCTPGYFSILHGIHTAHLTFSSGTLSLDKALLFAWHKISRRSKQCVCILSANETGAPFRAVQCHAEMLILYGGTPHVDLPATHILENFEISRVANCDRKNQEHESIYPELAADIFAGKQKRSVTSRTGECYTSIWRPLSQ